MSAGKIVYGIKIDTKHFEKQLRKMFIPRIRIAMWLIALAERIGKIEINYTIDQEK